MVVKGNRCIPDANTFSTSITQSAILSREYEAYYKEDELFVLNTCLFNPVDYNTTRFFELLKEKNLLWKDLNSDY